ncbi:P-loop containing nucleoside triphosphate hydrolase protein, partial [Tothia fuscella]
TQEYYEKNGSPLRRGWLLYGPPGSGKTSLAMAVATHFKLDLYMVSLGEMDDKELEATFARIPKRCVVLMEDIDCVKPKGKRTKADAMKTKGKETKSGPKEKKGKQLPATKVSLAGLLNVIDGIGAAEGRLLIMTANAPESLDKA